MDPRHGGAFEPAKRLEPGAATERAIWAQPEERLSRLGSIDV